MFYWFRLCPRWLLPRFMKKTVGPKTRALLAVRMGVDETADPKNDTINMYIKEP